MPILQKYRLPIIIAVIIIIAIAAGVHYFTGHPHAMQPVPDTTKFQSGDFSFAYSPLYDAKEYASGVVSLGATYQGGAFIPLIDIVEYKTDPDEAAPASFDAFAKHEAEALCGSDDSVEKISCTNPVETPYRTAAGFLGEELSLSLVRKNLSTGTTTTSTYAPVYVFDATPSGEPANYQGVFVYASFSSFLITGTTSPDLVEAVASSVTVQN